MKTLLFPRKPAPDLELQALKDELTSARGDLQAAYNQFDLAVEPELVESCVYQINAVQARCNYLIRAIKSRSPAAIPAAGLSKEDAAWT
jgi:hypothetical protein